jgi:hypothetical protein
MSKWLVLLVGLTMVGCASGGGGGNDETPPETPPECPVIVSRSMTHETRNVVAEDGTKGIAIIEYSTEGPPPLPEECPAPPPPVPPAPPTPPVPPAPPGTDDCFAFIGTQWIVQEDYVVDPANFSGLDFNEVVATFNFSLATWESNVSGAIYGTGYTGVVSSDARAKIGKSTNGVNEIIFDEVPFVNAIAVTWSWFVDGETLETDIVYDDVDFAWSFTGEPGTMDFHNITAHEQGHSIGLAHPSASHCGEQTMWSTAGYGETNKRTLEDGDIAGAQSLYGAPPNG